MPEEQKYILQNAWEAVDHLPQTESAGSQKAWRSWYFTDKTDEFSSPDIFRTWLATRPAAAVDGDLSWGTSSARRRRIIRRRWIS